MRALRPTTNDATVETLHGAAPQTGMVPQVCTNKLAIMRRQRAAQHCGIHQVCTYKAALPRNSPDMSWSCLPECMTKRPYKDRQPYESITVPR